MHGRNAPGTFHVQSKLGLNDTLRIHAESGVMVATQGVRCPPDYDPIKLLKAVANYTAFDSDNDSHDERDFGDLEIGNPFDTVAHRFADSSSSNMAVRIAAGASRFSEICEPAIFRFPSHFVRRRKA